MSDGVLSYPLHGQHKLSNHGYRTRDGHIIEWLGRFAAERASIINVISRPEPLVLAPFRRIRGPVALGTVPVQTITWRVPNLDPKQWWVRSAPAYPKVARFGQAPVVTWNPFTAMAPIGRSPFSRGRTVALDLLDDWTVHYAFRSIRREVEDAYRHAFDSSSVVFANAEGTLALAHRFGRSDAQLITNGVDPDKFAVTPNAHGPLTIGYAGLIGNRLNAQLISDVCEALPHVRFVFAGPFVDAGSKYQKLLTNIPNVELVGDVYYGDLPALLATFDLGWVPHAVGEGELGGDAIKIYEYRAAGLQVLTTPIMGAGRVLSDGVHVIPAAEQVSWLIEATTGSERLDRVAADIPAELTWRFKAQRFAEALGLEDSQ